MSGDCVYLTVQLVKWPGTVANLKEVFLEDQQVQRPFLGKEKRLLNNLSWWMSVELLSFAFVTVLCLQPGLILILSQPSPWDM